MNKFRLTFIFLLISCCGVFGQDINKAKQKIIIPENLNTPEFKNRLVDEALKIIRKGKS